MKVVLLLLVITIAACSNNRSNNHSLKDSDILSANNPSVSRDTVNTDLTKDSVITIQFPPQSNSVTVSGKLNGIDKPVTVNIPVTRGELLSVLVAPEDSVANIRINQVFMPDGKADGPFGRSLSRKITQQGNYKVIIGENLMQGDEWKGTFLLTVKVE